MNHMNLPLKKLKLTRQSAITSIDIKLLKMGLFYPECILGKILHNISRYYYANMDTRLDVFILYEIHQYSHFKKQMLNNLMTFMIRTEVMKYIRIPNILMEITLEYLIMNK